MNFPINELPLLLLSTMLAIAFPAAAEPPMRAVRLGFISGTVNYLPNAATNWQQAELNRPLSQGEGLWVDGNARAELQIGGAALRLGENTNVLMLNVSDRIAQLQLRQGLLQITVRSLASGQRLEIDTPNLALVLAQPGQYRIEVQADGAATAVSVQTGLAEVYGAGNSYTVTARHGYRFFAQDLQSYEALPSHQADAFDSWSNEREQRYTDSTSARYVSSEVVGYEELDANGRWQADANNGNVWIPNHVAADWTPYRDGHWAWVQPWGWTWIDDASWGYAVSHYGRWTNIRGEWAWVPGARRERAVYAPALVAFVGTSNFAQQGGASAAVAWFPLAPHEAYQPSYTVSRRYFDQMNRSNTVLAPQHINQAYEGYQRRNQNQDKRVTNITYLNQQVRGAVIAVPSQAFIQSHKVAKVVLSIPVEAAQHAQQVHLGASKPVFKAQLVVAATPPPHHANFVMRNAVPRSNAVTKPAMLSRASVAKIVLPEQAPQPPKNSAANAPVTAVKLQSPARAPAPPPAPAPLKPGVIPVPPANAIGTAEIHKIEAAKASQAEQAKKAADAQKNQNLATQATEAHRQEAARVAASKTEQARAEEAKNNAHQEEAAKAGKAEQARVQADNAKNNARQAEVAKNAQAAKVQAENARNQARNKAQQEGAAKAAQAENAKVHAQQAAAANAQNAAKAKADEAKAHQNKVEASKPNPPNSAPHPTNNPTNNPANNPANKPKEDKNAEDNKKEEKKDDKPKDSKR